MTDLGSSDQQVPEEPGRVGGIRSLSTRPKLRSFAQTYGLKAMDDVPFAAAQLGDLVEAEDELAMKARLAKLAYEVPTDRWHAIECQGNAVFSPKRFVDGSITARTVALLSVQSLPRPAILACVGAMSMHLEGRKLRRPPESIRVETVLALLSNGISTADLTSLSNALEALGVKLIASETRDDSVDFETIRRRTWDLGRHRMEELERAVLFDEPSEPTIVDGLLERHLTRMASHAMPAIGVVKRQLRRYLPSSHAPLLYDLNPNERTPAFILDTEHASVVTWYLRLSASARVAPGYGVVRLTCSQQFLEQQFPNPLDRWNELSALSSDICRLRHRERSYPRMGISLEPIVRLEDELHTLLPAIDQMAARLHRAFGV
jgi:hypothetical protein